MSSQICRSIPSLLAFLSNLYVAQPSIWNWTVGNEKSILVSDINLVFFVWNLQLTFQSFIIVILNQMTFIVIIMIPSIVRSSPEVLLGKDLLKICSKFAGEQPCRSVMSIKLLCIRELLWVRKKYCPVSIQMHLTFVNVILLNRTGMISVNNILIGIHTK